MRMPPSARPHRHILLLAGVSILLAISLSGRPSAVSGKSSGGDSLAARWTRAMDELHVPGMIVVVVNRDGIVRNDMLGVRDVERALPLDPDTRIYIASCTKPFVATVAALLATEGKLDLDAPVRRYLPRFTLADPGYADSVTVRDLLGHRPGLVNRAITRGDAHTGEMTEDRYYRLLGQVEPKRSFQYSNLHYTLLGRIIETVTGKSWKDVLAERIFQPAGMTRTTCYASVFWKDTNIARPYEFENGRYVTASPQKADVTMHAAGGIYSTGHDLARWLRLQLGDGMLDGRRVLPSAALAITRELLAPDAAEPHPLVKTERRLAWGAGWDVRTLRDDTLYCHNGTFAGSGAFMSFMPAPDLGVAVIANGGGISVFLAELVGAEAYDGAQKLAGEDHLPALLAIAARRASAETVPAANGELSRASRDYAGEFYHDDWGTLTVKAGGDSLDARIGVMPLPIRLTGRDRFITEGWAGRFEIDAAGKVQAVWLNTAAPDSARFERKK